MSGNSSGQCRRQRGDNSLLWETSTKPNSELVINTSLSHNSCFMSMMKLSQQHEMEIQNPKSSLYTFTDFQRSEPSDTDEPISPNKQSDLGTQVLTYCTGSQGHDDVVVTVNYRLNNEHNDDNERSISMLESFQYDDDIETFQYEYDGAVKDHFSDNSTAIVINNY